MNNDTPFTTHGDEALEARIVAWVLGEASAFEAAELERLCDERPELMVFKRRIAALHGMLHEAENAKPGESWRLPPEKRKAVESVLLENSVADIEQAREKRVKRSGRRALLAIAACLVLLIVIAGFAAPLMIKQRKKSDLALLESSEGTQRLRTNLPAELIEGTPQPMNVPNLETPVNGPAGSGTWSRSRAAVESERSLDEVHVGGQVGRPGSVAFNDGLTLKEAVDSAGGVTAFGTEKRVTVIRGGKTQQFDLADNDGEFRLLPGDAVELPQKRPWEVNGDSAPASHDSSGPAGSETWNLAARDSLLDQKAADLPEVARKPSPPASSRSKVIAANTVSPTAVQVPEVDVAAPSLDFGDGGGFGGSWGGGAGGGGVAAEPQLAKNGTASPSGKENARAYRFSNTNAPGDRYAGGKSAVAEELAEVNARQAGTRGVEGGREFNYPSEYEPPAAAGLAAPAAFPVTPATPSELGLTDSDAPVRSNPAQVDWNLFQHSAQLTDESGDADLDTSKLAEADTAKEKKSENHTGYDNEYRFRGLDLRREDEALPDDPEALAMAIRDQEDKVEERRKVLGTIVRTKGITYKWQDSFYSQSGVDEDLGTRGALGIFHDLEQEKLQLEAQLGSLAKYDNDQLMVYAAGLDLPDNAVRDLSPKYLEAKRQLSAEKAKGLADDHPSVKAKAKEVEAMKRQIEEGVVNLRATLQAQLDLTGNRLKDVEALKNESREEAIKRGLDAQDYVDAKRDFEQDQALLQQMKLKLMRAKAEAPKIDPAELMEEVPAADEPYSTFSLNINDASFRIAQAALAKGEQPDPAVIKVEQFYNAVDYGDPAPASDEPVACAIEQAAHPVIPGRNLVRIALKTAAAGRSAAQPLRLTLLVDQSGSMSRADRRAAMDKALAGLSGLLTKDDRVNVIGFSRTPRLLADGMTGDQSGKLADLVNQAASEGGTNLEEAMKLADQLALRHKQPGAQNRIVLFTDGAANLGDADPERLAAKVKDLRQKGIAFDIAGIAADDLNDALLGELARNGNGRYYVVGKDGDDNFASQLAGAFRPAAENVKVQVRFNPERVASYRLIGFEKDRLNTEDFRNDKVDAAELAAEEAGVAIYQVEPLPEGRGEIGEVSVRFRDTAAGEMVERSWTIPHDASAPALDRATPSMQLATLAMLAAEKLKGGPLGESVDLRQFAEAQANVKSFYSGNARVAELLRMLELLK